MAFIQSRTVRFGDVDYAGIVYYPRLFVYFHECFEDFFAHSTLSYKQVVDERRVGFPTVHAEADYKSPLAFGDELEIAMSNVRLGKKSVTFRYACTLRGQEACVGVITSACVNMDTFTAIEFPDYLRTLFSSIA